jgi:NADH-quinone oxidoreductase subunit N
MIGAPFIPAWQELRPFAAELCLIAAISAVLIVPFFVRRSNLVSGLVAAGGLLAALVTLLFTGGTPYAEHFRGLLVSDSAAVLWKIMLLVFVLGIVVMWLNTTRHTMQEGDGPEFFTLLLAATLGMALMASTSNLLMLVIAVEMASLPSYVLAGFRKTHRMGAEASLKYVLFGAACSAVMIYGLSLLYGQYGTLSLSGEGGIAWQIAHRGGSQTLLLFSLAAVLVGIGFKISAVPFHFWCPDVFEGASIEISAFLSVASKGAALMLLTRILMLVADALGYSGAGEMSLLVPATIIGVIGAITATVGNTAAYTQKNIKRLLAYSSIAHAGYMLCGLSLLVNGRSEVVAETGENRVLQAMLVYLMVYLFMNLGAFTAAGLVARATGTEELHGYRGLGRRSPMLALAMAVCLVSLVGLPPFAGFWAKLYLLLRLAANGSGWWVLVAVIGVNTVFSLYYYARILRAMYLEKSEEGALEAPAMGVGLALACAAILLVLFLGFGWMNSVTGAAAHLVGTSAQ